MRERFCIVMLLLLAAFAVGCSQANTTATPNANQAVENATKPAPDNSEITTKVDATGVKTEERVFHNNPRISRVVVTTRNGTRTVKAYHPSGEERDIKDETGDVLEATGAKIADGAGFVADKSEDVAGKTKDVGTKVGEKTVDTAKTVGEKSTEGAKTVADKSAEGAKTVADKSVGTAKTVSRKTVSGVKKAGSAVKKIIP